MANKQATTLTSIEFLLNGMISLLSWNSVLCSLDYFAAVYSDFNVYSLYPFSVFVAYLITAIFFHEISKKFSYLQIIFFGNVVNSLSIVALLILSIFVKNQLGFYLSLLICFFIGSSGNLMQLSYFAMINYLSEAVVGKFTVGTALSGVILTAIRIVVIAAFGEEPGLLLPIIIYFGISVLFNTINLVFNIHFLKSDIYK